MAAVTDEQQQQPATDVQPDTSHAAPVPATEPTASAQPTPPATEPTSEDVAKMLAEAETTLAAAAQVQTGAASSVPDGVQKKLASALGRDVNVMSSMTADTYGNAPKETVLISVPVNPGISTKDDEQAIRASLEQIPGVAELLTEPLGRKVHDMLQNVTSTDPVNGFDESERQALSDWKKVPEIGVMPLPDDSGIGIAIAIADPAQRQKAVDNLGARAQEIAQEIAANTGLQTPLEAKVEKAEDGGVILLLKQPVTNPATPSELLSVLPTNPNSENIVRHALFYAGNNWQETFPILSDKQERGYYLDYLQSEKSPEIQALLGELQQNTKPTPSRINFPDMDHPDQFLVRLIVPEGKSSNDLYSAILQGSAQQQQPVPVAPVTPGTSANSNSPATSSTSANSSTLETSGGQQNPEAVKPPEVADKKASDVVAEGGKGPNAQVPAQLSQPNAELAAPQPALAAAGR